MDLLIRGAMVYDGTGTPGVRREVGVSGGRVVAPESVGTARSLDADGLALAPGFIDIHSHADHTLPAFPSATNSISQGITTELVGLCGFSVAPVSADNERAEQLHELAHGFGPDLDWSWRSFAEFLDRMDAAHPAVNVAPLVGHHAIRILAMGIADRAPSSAELQTMRGALREALQAGAWGLSTGLAYVPGAFASTDELLALSQELAASDALYVSHLRDESDHLIDAIDEALHIGEALGIRTQVSHLKITAKRNAGKIGAALQHLDEARQRGVRAHADVYPYVAGSTYLHQLVPAWAKADGFSQMLERLRSREQRQQIRYWLEQHDTHQLAAAGGWDGILIAAVQNPSRRSAEGARIADLAARTRQDPLDYMLDLLLDDRGATTMVVFSMDESDMQAALAWRWSAVGSDQLGVTGPTARVHPRAYGTFARVLGWGVREAQLFSLTEAIRKMTALPAEILGLRDRGVIREGAVADLVLFDPLTVADQSTYDQPTLPARGVEHVLLEGEFAVEHGKPVRLDLGQVLRARGTVTRL